MFNYYNIYTRAHVIGLLMSSSCQIDTGMRKAPKRKAERLSACHTVRYSLKNLIFGTVVADIYGK